jgi:hypothetical protein
MVTVSTPCVIRRGLQRLEAERDHENAADDVADDADRHTVDEEGEKARHESGRNITQLRDVDAPRTTDRGRWSSAGLADPRCRPVAELGDGLVAAVGRDVVDRNEGDLVEDADDVVGAFAPYDVEPRVAVHGAEHLRLAAVGEDRLFVAYRINGELLIALHGYAS